MNKKVLITGGGGFLGSHVADMLFARGYTVRLLGHNREWPKYLRPEYEKMTGDVRRRRDWLKALAGVSHVIHLAAAQGSLPKYSLFTETNVTGTALMYEVILERELPIKKIVVASSQFVYGEGRWLCPKDGVVFPLPRTKDLLQKKIWDPVCPKCEGIITPLKNEETHQDPPNQYAVTKYAAELLALRLGKINGIPTTALRYSIVHGPRLPLKNSFSGILRIFAIQIINNQPITVYEDGKQRRDFVAVGDAARATVLALEDSRTDNEVFNVGGAKSYSVIDVAEMLMAVLKNKVPLEISGNYRVGDIRHAVSAINKLGNLGWSPKISEEEAIGDYIQWFREQYNTTVLDDLVKTTKRLRKSGIIGK